MSSEYDECLHKDDYALKAEMDNPIAFLEKSNNDNMY